MSDVLNLKRYQIRKLLLIESDRLGVSITLRWPRGTKNEYINEYNRLRSIRPSVDDSNDGSNNDVLENISNVITEGGEYIINNFNTFSKEDVINHIIDEVTLGSEFVITIKLTSTNDEVTYYTVTINNRDHIRNIFLGGDKQVIAFGKTIRSYDRDELERVRNFKEIKIISDKLKFKEYRNREGGFFKYLVNVDIYLKQWSKYGLFKEIGDNYKLNCLTRALINSEANLTESEVESLKDMIITRETPLSKIKLIVEPFNIRVNLKQLDKSGKTKSIIINKEGTRVCKIGLVDNHYFCIDKDTSISSYTINNFKSVKDIDNNKWKFLRTCKRVKSGYSESRKDRSIDSFKLFVKLLKYKDDMLELITLDSKGIFETQFYNRISTDIKFLKYDEDCVRRLMTPIELQRKAYNKIESIKHFVKPNTKITKDFTSQICKVLDVDEVEAFRIISAAKKDKSNNRKVFFDFETAVDGVHEPYLLCCSIGRNEHVFIKKDSNDHSFITDFLKLLKDGDICIAHNLGYDFRILLKYAPISFISVSKPILSGKSIMFIKCKYEGKTIIFKDSYAMISSSLSKFPKMFDLKDVKAVYNYNVYTIKSMFKEDGSPKNEMDMDVYSKSFNEEDKKSFESNVKDWGLKISNSNDFKFIDYSIKYCKMDCKLLQQGYEKFNKDVASICTDILKIPVINIVNVISISSLAHKMGLANSNYYGCFEISGHVRSFIQNCLVGGKCMSANNEMWKVEQIKGSDNSVNDFDANSSYPSAMVEGEGFIKGSPKVIDNSDLNMDFLENIDYYFVEIDITDVPKKRRFPVIPSKDKNGVRQFSNDTRGRIYVDKITLEDMMEFHEMVEYADFEIVRGYYYDEGFNKKVRKFANKLYKTRAEKKVEKNPIQTTIKLLMNSIYGKTCQKPMSNSTVIKNSKKEGKKYIRKNHNHVNEFSVINEGTDKERYLIVKTDPINKHFNSAHQACTILSQAKRSMNQVMMLAEDIGIKIVYMDTDSMHIITGRPCLTKLNSDGLMGIYNVGYSGGKIIDDCLKPSFTDIVRLRNAYKKKYGKELCGKGVGQFHCDFDFTSKKNYIPRSVKTLVIAKKLYIHMVECKQEGSDIVNYEIHARSKGVPSWALDSGIEFNNRKTLDKYVDNNKLIRELQYVNSVEDFIINKKLPKSYNVDNIYTKLSLKNDKLVGKRNVEKMKMFENIQKGSIGYYDISEIAKSKKKALFKVSKNYNIQTNELLSRSVSAPNVKLNVIKI